MWRRLRASLGWIGLTLVAVVLVSATVDAAVHRVSGPVTATRPNGTSGHAERSAAVVPVTPAETADDGGQLPAEPAPLGTARSAMAMAPPDVAAAATAGAAAPRGDKPASSGSAPPATATAADAPAPARPPSPSTTTAGSRCCRWTPSTTEPRPSSTTTSPPRSTTTTEPPGSTTTSTSTSTSTTTRYDR